MALTLAPNPWFTGFDDEGNIVPGGKLFTYAAGTSTKKNTYTDVLGAVANTNPIILDDAGRVPSGLFLLPSSYKFVLAPADDTDPPANPIRSQDNIGAVPTTDIDNDVSGTAGEAFTASQSAYLSDGSGGLIAGRWYLADADNAYSSTFPEVAFAVTDVAVGATGTFRLSGRQTGFVGLTPGADYFLSGTAGAITATAPANARYVGRADSITSIIATPNPAPATVPMIPQGRLTLTSGSPVTSGDVTAATTLYFAPYLGNQLSLYDGSAWRVYRFSQLSIAVPASASQMYDVFVYSNAGVVTLELTAWTNDTTRATALTTQDGWYVKTGATTRLYLGSFRTTAVSGQTEDSFTKRFVWNYYNRVPTPIRVMDATDTWAYSTAAYRQANNSPANQIAIVTGLVEDGLSIQAASQASNDGGGVSMATSIGLDSTTVPATGVLMYRARGPAANQSGNAVALLSTYPSLGYHFYAWLENDQTGSGTTTWTGDAGTPTLFQTGMSGWWRR